MKTVWRFSELGKIGEILNNSRTALTQEFLKEHPDWQTGEFLTTKKAVELIIADKNHPKYKDHQEVKKKWFNSTKLLSSFANKFWDPNRTYRKHGYEHGDNEAWMLEAVRYLDYYINKGEYKKPNKIEVNGIKYADSSFKEAIETYPTSKTLVSLWSDYTGSAFYSIIDRNNKIPIHTAPGNRDRKTLRIHIPLIIPKNTGWKQLGFESEGTKLVWDEVWGFDNQSLHSAWNYTNERRLVFIIDLDRDFLNVSPAPKRLFKSGTWSNFAIQYTRRALRWYF
jgi:hypothetical protein